MANLSQLSLYPATAEQTLESRRRTWTQWAKGMTLEQYLERDRLMDGHEHARDGKLITWVLAPRDNPFTLDFMCSCETFRRVGIVARTASDGQVVLTDVPCYGIASVFTPASKRNNGYAAHMMRLLHWVLAPEGAIPASFPASWGAHPASGLQDAAFSVLYSDIGDKFYHRNCSCLPNTQLGWVATGTISTTWTVKDMVLGSAEWKLLSKEDAVSIWEEDTLMMKNDAIGVARTGALICSFLPDKGVGLFNIERVIRFDDVTPVLPMSIWGVQIVQDSHNAPLVFATWTLEYGNAKTMVLTRLRATKDTFRGLLAKIMGVARQNGIETIETWNLPEDLLAIAVATGGKTFTRQEHLSSIKWYGAEAQDKVQWLFNEKFCWC